MRFLHGKMKAHSGEGVAVEFSAATRVLIMNEQNFNRYRNNQTFTYYGGFKEASPYEFQFPKSGTWFIVVEKGSLSAPKNISASFRKIEKASPAPLPPAAENTEAEDSSSSVDEMLDE